MANEVRLDKPVINDTFTNMVTRSPAALINTEKVIEEIEKEWRERPAPPLPIEGTSLPQPPPPGSETTPTSIANDTTSSMITSSDSISHSITGDTSANMTPQGLTDPNTIINNLKILSPAGESISINEPSVASDGNGTILFSGNVYFMRSNNGGMSWSSLNPFVGMSDMCCDQDVLYSEQKDLFF